MQKSTKIAIQDYGTNCNDCERYSKLGDICMIEHGKKFAWEYCRDFNPNVVLPDYKELMRSVRADQALERKKQKEKREREKRRKLKERAEREELRKKKRRAMLRKRRERLKKRLLKDQLKAEKSKVKAAGRSGLLSDKTRQAKTKRARALGKLDVGSKDQPVADSEDDARTATERSSSSSD